MWLERFDLCYHYTWVVAALRLDSFDFDAGEGQRVDNFFDGPIQSRQVLSQPTQRDFHELN
jgi:hypothetical protein